MNMKVNRQTADTATPLKHTLLNRLFYPKWDHNLVNEPHAV